MASVSPILLVDLVDEGIEERGWVEAIVTPEAACDFARPWVVGLDEEDQPLGISATTAREWLKPDPKNDPIDDGPWEKCDPADDGAVEFIVVEVHDAEDESPAERLERWESSGYGRSGGSSGDRVEVLRRFVRDGTGCAECSTPATCVMTQVDCLPCSPASPSEGGEGDA